MKRLSASLLIVLLCAMPAEARERAAGEMHSQENYVAALRAPVPEEMPLQEEVFGPPYPGDMEAETPAEDIPAHVKEEIYRVETNPCDSKDVKEFLVGNYIIVGQKNSATPIPTKSDLYTAAADIKLDGCNLKIVLCTAGGQETGEMKGILALADKIPMWKVESTTKTGELKEYFLQMTSDLDNYPVLYGQGHQGYEFWRPDQNETAACP